MPNVPLIATKMLLTVREAAAALAISERTLWTLTQSGELPCVRIGRSVRYSPETLRECIAQMQVPPDASSQPFAPAGR